MKRYAIVAPIALLFLGFLIAQNNESPNKIDTDKKDSKSTTEKYLESLSDAELYKLALIEQREKANPSLKTGKADTELNTLKSDLDSKIEEHNKKIEQRKKELAAKNINIDTITPSEIQKLIEDKIVTLDEAENLFTKEKLMLLPSRFLFSEMGMGKPYPILVSNFLYDLRFFLGLPVSTFDEKLKDAIREFQRFIGAEPTGELLFGENEKLMELHKQISPKDIALPMYSYVDLKDSGIDYIKLAGTWIIKGDEPAFPIQTSEIELDKQTMTGIEAQAEIQYSNSNYFTVCIIHWKITKWNDDEIVAENDAPMHASYTLSVDRKNEKVNGYRHPKGKVNDKFVLEPKLLELVSGSQVDQEYNRKQFQKGLESCNPKYRAIMDQLKKDLEKSSGEQDKKESKNK